ncbi:MAG: cupin domain-containing protein [Candidatus Binatia bacterium]
MPVQFVDVIHHKKLRVGYSKKVLAKTDEFHVWIHGDRPGVKGPMHRHTADETFYCIQGECTIVLRKGLKTKLKPGRLVFIPKGEYYRLHNSGSDYMMLLGSRSEAHRHPRFSTKGKKVGGNRTALKTSSGFIRRRTRRAKDRQAAARGPVRGS